MTVDKKNTIQTNITTFNIIDLKIQFNFYWQLIKTQSLEIL